MSNWKTAFRSLYYAGAPEPDDPVLVAGKVALLVIDVQNTYLERPNPASIEPDEQWRYDTWTPFHERMHGIVIPAISRLIGTFRDRSLSQRKPGWNNLLLPKDGQPSRIVDALKPLDDEIVVTKTTDSALTGTNLRLILANLGITHVVCTGIFTDQCVSSTVRSLADESFDVIVVEDACAAGSHDLHLKELEIMNMIYCSVMQADDLLGYLPSEE